MPKKIYLACPYSHKDKHVEAERFWAANAKAGEIMSQGYIVFSPISHSHPIHLAHDLPGDWEFWKEFDEAFISWCDEVWVYRLPGYEESKGIKAEIALANVMNKPVRFIFQ